MAQRKMFIGNGDSPAVFVESSKDLPVKGESKSGNTLLEVPESQLGAKLGELFELPGNMFSYGGLTLNAIVKSANGQWAIFGEDNSIVVEAKEELHFAV